MLNIDVTGLASRWKNEPLFCGRHIVNHKISPFHVGQFLSIGRKVNGLALPVDRLFFTIPVKVAHENSLSVF